MSPGKRQIFHPTIGRSLAAIREGRNLSQGQVAMRAKGQVSEGTIKAIETGRIKNPDPDHLRALANIYGVSFESIAEPFVVANYGRDLIRHVGDQQSDASPSKGASPDETAAARVELQELRDLVARYEKEAREVRTATDSLVKVALALETLRKTPKRESHRRRSDRKVG